MNSILAGDLEEHLPHAELYCRSNFTFLTGAAEPEDLVERTAAKMYSALALTDECTVSGVVRGHLAARENSLHFIVGSEILLTTAGGTAFARIVFLAQDRLGYGNLCELITLARTRAPKQLPGPGCRCRGQDHQSGASGGHAGLPGADPAGACSECEVAVRTMHVARTWFTDRAWVLAPRTLALGKEQIAPMCSPSLKAKGRSWKQVIGELTLIDSQLSQVTWRDWFNLNKLQLPGRPRQSFDRGALSISAAADGLGVALETTRFAERELARGDLVVAGEYEFQPIIRENHFFSQRTNERQVEKVKKFKDWLLKEVHGSVASTHSMKAQTPAPRRTTRKQKST